MPLARAPTCRRHPAGWIRFAICRKPKDVIVGFIVDEDAFYMAACGGQFLGRCMGMDREMHAEPQAPLVKSTTP